ncbi:hypothetical protein AQ490_24270 [Wenjunlia vitaminophila]|uniref:Uncharacterized protein n=1 Tax=Wenjunlia vitaminophila TaxID=76728 RepID=A0A0T6LS82_WENVI|nr:terpene cyclase/mutase family protein [Wenjunlia vitaminophila]KRV48652.1 hypothetical protein AQ490_24270 [Wenjunlia vitaminophila]
MPLLTRRRTAAAVIPSAALVTALLLPAPTHAEQAPPPLKSPANAGATWIASKLTDGTHASGDHGLTADVVLALASTGTGGATADKATDWLAANAEAYITRGTPGAVFAGGAAKLAMVAAVEHRDPRNFGGQDLVGTLLGRLQDNGRFTDDLPGDGSNQFTQSLAVLALQRTGDLPAKAVDFLAGTRCADGGYPLYFKTDPTKCKSHTDSTGLAVQALLAAGRTADAKPGLDWLEQQQLPDGSFRDNGFGTPPGNSNSTALDVQALAAGGRTEAAAKGLTWLKGVQVDCSGAAADRGAVGYSEPKADGVALRATAQAVPALAGKSLGEIDGKGAAKDLEPVDCTPGTPGGDPGGNSDGNANGDPGGNPGGGDPQGTSSGNGDPQGTSNGTDSNGTDSNGTESNGTTDGTDTQGADGGTTDGSTGGTDPTPDPSPSASTGGTTSTTGTTGDDYTSTSGGTTDGGKLAATGSSTLPLAGGAAALLFAGVTAVTLTRLRRQRRA